MKRAAIFSDDHGKRFKLTREWSSPMFARSRGTVNFIMLNPSVADDQSDDPTIRKCIGFADRWGYAALVVTNLIPIISTDPWKLPPWHGVDSENRAYLLDCARKADLVTVAWGSVPGSLAKQIALAEHIYLLRHSTAVKFHCIGWTRKGDPLHPSRAPYTDRPIVWNGGFDIDRPILDEAGVRRE